MTFQIATGDTTSQIVPKSSGFVADSDIRFTDWTRADRCKRQVIEAIEAHECPDDLDNYVAAESLIIDALYMFDPSMSEDIETAHTDHKSILIAGLASVKSAPGGTGHPEKKEKKMLKIDTGTSDGPSGPFLSYKQRAGQGMGDGSWYMREKDGDDWSYSDMTETMKNGIVADIFATHAGELGGSLQMGYIKFNDGSAPDRSWWQSPLRSEQRPDETKAPGGGFAWQNIISFRVAIGGGRDAQMDVSGWGGYKGMTALIGMLNNGFADNVGKCPVIQYTGFRTEGTGAKRMHVPEWRVAQWVDRPECLKPDTPAIATASTPIPEQAAPVQTAPVQAAPVTSVPEAAGF